MICFRARKSAAVVACLVLVLIMALTTGRARAAQPDEGNIPSQIVRASVNWTIPADVCAQLPAGVSLSGTGKRFAVVTTRTKPNGAQLIINSDFVVGTATDSNSNSYNFIYTNQDRHLVPVGGSPIKVHMTDLFLLTGNGGANNYTVGFEWTWQYSPPEQEWPPVHNWNQTVTHGDPFTCDPL